MVGGLRGAVLVVEATSECDDHLLHLLLLLLRVFRKSFVVAASLPSCPRRSRRSHCNDTEGGGEGDRLHCSPSTGIGPAASPGQGVKARRDRQRKG